MQKIKSMKWLFMGRDACEMRIKFIAYLLLLAACVVFVWCNVASRVFLQRNGEPGYHWGPAFPAGIVAGHDFWVTYTYAKILRDGNNIKTLPDRVSPNRIGLFEGARGILVYPPLAFFLYIPYTFLHYNSAYFLHLALLVLANIIVVLMAVWLTKVWVLDKYSQSHGVTILVYATSSFVLFSLITSYGFIFSAERGSSDALSIMFAWLFLYVLIKFPARIWVQCLLLSCAINLKVTPVIFCVLLLWKHRWRCIIPLVLINSSLLFVWGPENAFIFIKGLARLKATPDGWWGDHSAFSFAFTVLKFERFTVPVVEKCLIAAAISQWVFSACALFRRGYSPGNAIMLFSACIPVMMMAPNCSNDYKLILLYGPCAVFLLIWCWRYAYHVDILSLFFILILIISFALLGKSGGFATHLWMTNKFPFVFLMGALMALEIARKPIVLADKDLIKSLKLTV